MKKIRKPAFIIVAVIVAAGLVFTSPGTLLKAMGEESQTGDESQQTVTVSQEETDGGSAPEEEPGDAQLSDGQDNNDQSEEIQLEDDTDKNSTGEDGQNTVSDNKGESGSEDQSSSESRKAPAKAAEKAPRDYGTFEVSVEGEDEPGDYIEYSGGVLTIKETDKAVTVKNKNDGATTDRIVVAGSATVILDGVNIAAAGGPAIKVDPGVKATVTLKSGSENTVTGAANYAGIEVGYEDGNLASLTLNGAGQLKATGGDKSAGIGGGYNSKTSQGRNTSSYCGNITIEGDPVINATGTNGGAGIGSANNNGVNSDGTTQSRSYKMQYSEIGAITIKGGDITAEGRAGAGIGGGNHCDSGVITIEGGTIHASSNDGAGIGCGRGSSNYGGDADKGHGYYFADVTVNGGTIYLRRKEPRSGSNSKQTAKGI